jgi:hypothetical protein
MNEQTKPVRSRGEKRPSDLALEEKPSATERVAEGVGP